MDFFEMLQDDIDHTFFDEDIFCEKKNVQQSGNQSGRR